MALKYRPEIDGLRAIAVISVILFHAGIPFFSGGYVGVDVFFVISGYLITTIVLTQNKNGVFSYKRFYERRVRRIFPALFVVVFSCIPLSWMFMSSGMIWDFWQSIIATPVFLTNVLFTLENGYFELGTDIKPLIHIWSLSVEEQFYIIFPAVFIIITSSFNKAGVYFFVILILVFSLMWAQFDEYISIQYELMTRTLLRINESGWASFYMPFGRVWELLSGSLVALVLFDNKRSNYSNLPLSFFGLFLVFFAIFSFDKNTNIPGFHSLIPVVGTMMLILFTSKNNLIGTLLSKKYIVLIGLMSYSLYLWHQPIFAFYRIVSLEEPSIYHMVFMIILVFILSWVTWNFIEQPFRDNNKYSLKFIVFFSIVGSLIFISSGFFGLSEAGRSLHYDYLVKDIPNNRINMVMDLKKEGSKARKFSNALSSDDFSDDGRVKILLLGDSQVGNWGRAVSANNQLFSGEYEFRSIGIDALCYPFISSNMKFPIMCQSSIEKIRNSNLINQSDHVFILESFTGDTVKNLSYLRSFLDKNSNKLIVVANAEFTDLTKLSLDLARSSDDVNVNSNFLYEHRLDNVLAVHDQLKFFATKNKIKVVSEFDLYCNYSKCQLFSKQLSPFMYDTMHVTDVGALFLGKSLYGHIENYIK